MGGTTCVLAQGLRMEALLTATHREYFDSAPMSAFRECGANIAGGAGAAAMRNQNDVV
jgi:hypothetical protein